MERKQYMCIIKKPTGEHVQKTVNAPATLEGALAAIKAAAESCGDGAELQNVNTSAIDIVIP
jgi:hypothetical protein